MRVGEREERRGEALSPISREARRASIRSRLSTHLLLLLLPIDANDEGALAESAAWRSEEREREAEERASSSLVVALAALAIDRGD